MTGARNQLHTLPGVTLIETRGEPQETTATDLVACVEPGKIPCFLLLWWQADQLAQAEMFWTEAEARACLAHGRFYNLDQFAIPSDARRVM